MSSQLFVIPVSNILTILKKNYRERGRKIRILEKNTTDLFQLKIMLDTGDSVAVGSEKYLRKTKRVTFEDL